MVSAELPSHQTGNEHLHILQIRCTCKISSSVPKSPGTVEILELDVQWHMKALRDAYYAQIVLLNREELLTNPRNMTTGQQQADPQQTDNRVYQQSRQQSQKRKADIQMPVIQAFYPDLGIWVLHLSVLHQQLAPNVEQILYSQ